MGKDLEATYAPQTGGSATDLRVCDKQHTESPGRNHIVAEDKRGRVWLEHECKVLELMEAETFPSYSKQHDPKPEPAVRIRASNRTYYADAVTKTPYFPYG
jgi:hypothetical protein